MQMYIHAHGDTQVQIQLIPWEVWISANHLKTVSEITQDLVPWQEGLPTQRLRVKGLGPHDFE